MTRYILRDDLSFCLAGGRLVLLDIGSDRYLRLSPRLESKLVEYLSADTPNDDVSDLVAHNILVELPHELRKKRPSAPSAMRSAMETPPTLRRPSPAEALEIFATVLHARLALKIRPLKKVLDGMSSAGGMLVQGLDPDNKLSEASLVEGAAMFRQVRLFVPVRMRCLVDSIALTRFLRRRGFGAHLVFGVAVDPFSAHCWVQADDLVLNDTLGNVTSHTPIRVV